MNPFTPSVESKPNHALTVSELNREAKRLLEVSFGEIWVIGEISSFSRPRSGHWYFTLKDDNAQVRCAMFKNSNLRLRYQPGDGDQVLARARVSLYEGRGDYQLIVEHIEPFGAGSLQKAFEALKEKLRLEGLFESRLKQPIPLAPSRIGVITSSSGAAIHDILSVLARRSPSTEVILIPVLVQGESAADSIVKAIEKANKHAIADVLIVGRGGGSLEDLWAFNEEPVARAIFASKIPVVSAVGHEVDFTIADFVADKRAPTPSAAAEMLSRDQTETTLRLDDLFGRLGQACRKHLSQKSQALSQLHERLQPPRQQFASKQAQLEQLTRQLSQACSTATLLREHQLSLLYTRLGQHSPAVRIGQYLEKTEQLDERLKRAAKANIQRNQTQFENLCHALDAVSPLATLKRGYAIARKTDQSLIRSTKDVQKGENIQVEVTDGTIACTVGSPFQGKKTGDI